MNVMNRVEHVLELTELDRVFEFCSVEDMLRLLHSAAVIGPRSVDQANRRIMKDSKYSGEGQDPPPAVERNSLPAGTAARAQEWAEVPAEMESAKTGVRISNEGSSSGQQHDSHCQDARVLIDARPVALSTLTGLNSPAGSF